MRWAPSTRQYSCGLTHQASQGVQQLDDRARRAACAHPCRLLCIRGACEGERQGAGPRRTRVCRRFWGLLLQRQRQLLRPQRQHAALHVPSRRSPPAPCPVRGPPRPAWAGDMTRPPMHQQPQLPFSPPAAVCRRRSVLTSAVPAEHGIRGAVAQQAHTAAAKRPSPLQRPAHSCRHPFPLQCPPRLLHAWCPAFQPGPSVRCPLPPCLLLHAMHTVCHCG